VLVVVSLATAVFFLQAGKSDASGDVSAGRQYYQLCITCHGQRAEGSTPLRAPKLAGQHDWYLVRQLQNFKSGVRGTDPQDIYGQQMRPMAMTLPDDQAIEDVVAYIQTLPSR
jgi:cytochrome c553